MVQLVEILAAFFHTFMYEKLLMTSLLYVLIAACIWYRSCWGFVGFFGGFPLGTMLSEALGLW